MSEDMQFIKTRANFVRHAYIEEMEKYLLAFDSEISKRNIKIKWIIDEEELVDEVEKDMLRKTYNKVCFDIKKIPQALLEKKNFIKMVNIADLEKNTESAEHIIVQADFGIVENARRGQRPRFVVPFGCRRFDNKRIAYQIGTRGIHHTRNDKRR